MSPTWRWTTSLAGSGLNGLVARRAVDANGDGREEGFVTSTGGASNDACNLFVLAGCQLRQVRVAGAGALQILAGGSVGHAEGFDCQGTDRHGRRLLILWGVVRAEQQPDGGSAYTYTKTSYRWVGDTLVRQVSVDRGGVRHRRRRTNRRPGRHPVAC
jgi:hypothetical protein